MTINEFDSTSFNCNSRIIYNGDGEEYGVAMVDFEEKLIGIEDPLDEEQIKWVRCENCKKL